MIRQTVVKALSKDELDFRVADLLKRGYTVVNTGEFSPIIAKDMIIERKYWAQLRRVDEDENVSQLD